MAILAAFILKNMIYQEKEKTIDYFQSRGWQAISNFKTERVSTKPGEEIRCGDDGYGKDAPLAPAVFGAIEGVAAHVHWANKVADRFKIGADLVEKSGYLPGSHGDLIHGDIDGCKFRWAWLEGLFPWLPALTRRDIRVIRFLNDIHHHTLTRKRHTGEGLVLNFEPHSTVIPHGRFYVKDLWYLRHLGFELDDSLKITAETAELVLPKTEDRRLLVA